MKSKYFLLLFFFTLALLKTSAQRPFITTWDTRRIGESDTTQIIFYATGDNFQIGWVNMTDASDTGNAVGINGADTISFPAPGIYKVYIAPGSGSFSAVTLSNNNDVNFIGDGKKLLSIEQWGDINWSTFNTAFANCSYMVMNAPDIPNLSNVTDMSAAFYYCWALTTNAAMSNWDVSSVTDMGAMFSGARSFNQSISNWDVSNVTNMEDMLNDAILFNQPIGNWNVSNVTNMGAMFSSAQSFNQPIGNWNVSNVTDMGEMFGGANSFNQPIGNWDVSKVINMGVMFLGVWSFNQPIGNWNVSNVTDMNTMFAAANSFNQPIGRWDVSNVTDMNSMFSDATSFNQPIGNWNVSNVTNMRSMFEVASSFNQPIDNWNVSNVTDMFGMFLYANNFNQPMGNWNVSNVTNMFGMFAGDSSFNQPIGNWDVSKVINMDIMFLSAGSFNQPVGNWNVSNVKNMFEMFEYARKFNQPIGNWDMRNVTDVREMLDSCGMDCDNYSATLRGWAANPALQNYLVLGAANLTYDSALAKAAHDSLTNIKGWTITGDAVGHCSVLPVNFISFSVIKQGNAALLNWSVANEINNNGYYVEKSTNGLSFISIAFVAGKSASKQTSYTYTDNNLTNGKMYYRIKEIDNDGKYMYSGIQEIELSNFVWKIHGNPVNNSFIELMLDKPANISITIVSSNGNIIKTIKKGNLITGNYSIPLNIDNISAGLYVVKLMVDDKAYTSAVIKQ